MRNKMRTAKATGLALALLCAGASAQETLQATFYKMPYCGCCEGHVEHLRENGIEVEVHEVNDLTPIRREHAVPSGLEGCHTLLIDGYVVEGHVPADTIRRLLDERPGGVAGISIPGMPVGLPGMPGEPEGPIDVYAFGEGVPTVFAQE
jgi:hypothetical protein